MSWVLVVITVFTTSSGVSTETRFHDFATSAACEAAAAGISAGVGGMKGTIGRDVFTACYPKG
ncbi:MAG: hypothetical protein H6983_13330 [Ectothiorhodospiraceae bacterium]|nr:hypothetical protein [Ectothiorhodospiraceae bacterium]